MEDKVVMPFPYLSEISKGDELAVMKDFQVSTEDLADLSSTTQNKLPSVTCFS